MKFIFYLGLRTKVDFLGIKVCTFEYFMRFLTLSSAPSYSSAVTIITNVMSTPPRTQKSRIRFTIYFSTLAVKLKYNNN